MAALVERLGALRAAIAQACAQSGRSADSVTLIAVTKGGGVFAFRPE